MSEIEGHVVDIGLTLDAIGRTGASSVEIDHADHDPCENWWATAHFGDKRVTCENQESPLAAVVGLYAMIAAGGLCTTCEKIVGLHNGETDQIAVGARMRDGVFETRLPLGSTDQYCVRRFTDEGWTGCTDA